MKDRRNNRKAERKTEDIENTNTRLVFQDSQTFVNQEFIEQDLHNSLNHSGRPRKF